MKRLLITGSPGIGKTTLIKKLINHIKLEETEYDGFYTEEIRNNNYRIGFEIVTLDGKRAILAKKGDGNETSSKPMVGQYQVYINEFEQLALPILEKPKRLLIIDEIGKMEMFSKKFEDYIGKIFNNKNITVVATVPLKGGPLLVRQLKERKDCELITVTQFNRDSLLNDVIHWFEQNK